MNKKVIIICGPTACGKSKKAIDFALETNGIIINCDSMQVYDILNVLTARPEKKDLEKVAHKLYGFLNPATVCNASFWRKLALQEIDDAIAKGKQPIIVGGTGMYIKSLIEGLSPIPDINENIRNEVRKNFKEKGGEIIYNQLHDDDKKVFHKNDSQRICRALEVYKSTGKSMQYWNSLENVGIRKDLEFETITMLPNLKDLEEKQEKRFIWMLENGAIDEVKELMNLNLDPSVPAMNAIGVKPIIEYLEEKISKEEMIKIGILQTRQYAKRQITWFKKH